MRQTAVGVAVLRRAVAMAAEAATAGTPDCGDAPQPEVDAPSGTAKLLLAAAIQRNSCCLWSRVSVELTQRQKVAIVALRGGTVAGTHEFILLGRMRKFAHFLRALYWC